MYSLQTENRPDALSSALVKTAEYRYPRPGAIEEFVDLVVPELQRRGRFRREYTGKTQREHLTQDG